MSKRSNGVSIFTRELFSYFNSPIAYIFIVVFVALINGMFMSQFFLIGSADMRHFFGLLPIILCVFIPAITMRLWAEEKKGNTFELLLTFPMETYKLVLGKFTAGLAFYLVTLLGTIFVPVMLLLVGKPDIGPIIGGYLGAFFIGAFFLSVGIFISGLCKDQIVSFIVAMIACFFFYLSGLDFMASLVDGWLPGVGNFLKMNFGMTHHFAGFQRGVIDNRDILYFLVMITIFLALNIFSIEDRLRPKAKIFFSTAVGICIAISMVINSLFMDIPLGRYDLTENKLYTVTESSRKILESLKAPVTVKLYISPKENMPTAMKSLEQDIVDRLDELKVFSGGNLSYKLFHMEVLQQAEEGQSGDSLEDKLQEKGISPFQVRSIEQDEVGIKLVYSAIAIAYKEKEEAIIPRIVPQNINNLEYELISRIYRMTLEKRPKVALVAPYTDKEADSQMQQIMKQLGQALPSQYREDKFRYLGAMMRYEDYDVQRIRLTEEEPIPDETDTLILTAPERLNERQRYEINRFLVGGGNVIIAAQGYTYNYRPAGMQGISITPQKIEHGLNELLKNYGVTVSDKLLMDNQSDTISISGSMSYGPFEVSVPVKVPTQVLVTEETMNPDVSITGRLSKFLYLWGSALDIEETKVQELKLKQTTLFTSSEESWLVEHKGGALKSEDLQKGALGYAGRQNLGMLLEGQFPDAFEGKVMPPWPRDEDTDESVVDESVEEDAQKKALELQPGKLLVMGCSKMFEEDIIRNGGMANLFMNSVDALTLGGELIKIRGHQPINRSIKTVKKIEKLWYRFMTIFLTPIGVIIFGSIRAIIRRKEKEQYLKLLPVSVE